MFFSWFDTTEAEATGLKMANLLIVGLPAKLLQGNNRNVNKQQKLLENIYAQIEQENIKRKLNAFKKAKMADAFQKALLAAGYEPDFVLAVTKRLVMKVAYGQERF